MTRTSNCWFLFVALTTFPLQGCLALYSAKETTAVVVDAETKQPLEGVNVVANWVLEYGHFGDHQYTHVTWILMETVTDRSGSFSFPAWGPKAVPASLPMSTSMSNRDPQVTFFKSGYVQHMVFNQITGPVGRGELLRSWSGNGKTIELKRFNGDLLQYGFGLRRVLTRVGWPECNWKKIPRMILALHKEDEKLKRQGIKSNSMSSFAEPSIEDLEQDARKYECGSVADFLRGYQQ